MPTNVVVKLFALVAGTLDDVSNNPVTTEQFKRVVKTSEHFLAGFKQYPDIVIAQPLLYKSRQSYLHNLAFNTLAYCAVLCNRAKINDLCCQQLLCAIITLYGERQTELTDAFANQSAVKDTANKHKINKRLAELLEKTQQHSWLSGYAVFTKLYFDPLNKPRWPRKLNRVQRIIYSAHVLSVALTHRQNKKSPSFSQVFRMLIQSAPVEWHEDLSALLEYPTLVPPGTLIQSKPGQHAIVLSVSATKILVCNIDPSDPSNNHLSRLYTEHVKKPLGAQMVSGFTQIHHWWNEQWSEERADFTSVDWDTYPLDKPPAVLLAVQKHLNSGDVDIDKLATQISEEPAFAEFLKKAATFSNRNKLPVQQVKHGLMMHGYERTNNMLIEQALLLRLNQHYFPLQQNFTQFVHFAAQIAAELAKAQGDISPEQASNLLCFACSGLFTQPSLKSRTRWEMLPTKSFNVAHLIKIKQQDNLTSHAVKLSIAWQQPKLFVKALEQHQQMPDDMSGNKLSQQLGVLLGISVLLARQLFFNETDMCKASQDYAQQAASKLSLSTSTMHTIALNAMTNSHSYQVM
ncbi:MAG: hypothetical protein Alis3KO_25490 [Aliiglaciecola sp.]